MGSLAAIGQWVDDMDSDKDDEEEEEEEGEGDGDKHEDDYEDENEDGEDKDRNVNREKNKSGKRKDSDCFSESDNGVETEEKFVCGTDKYGQMLLIDNGIYSSRSKGFGRKVSEPNLKKDSDDDRSKMRDGEKGREREIEGDRERDRERGSVKILFKDALMQMVSWNYHQYNSSYIKSR